MERLHPDALALSAFRLLKDGRGRQFSIADWSVSPEPWKAIDHLLRRAVTKVRDSQHDDYAVLDVLGPNDQIIQDYGIPTAAAFNWWRKKLQLVVSLEDAKP